MIEIQNIRLISKDYFATDWLKSKDEGTHFNAKESFKIPKEKIDSTGNFEGIKYLYEMHLGIQDFEREYDVTINLTNY